MSSDRVTDSSLDTVTLVGLHLLRTGSPSAPTSATSRHLEKRILFCLQMWRLLSFDFNGKTRWEGGIYLFFLLARRHAKRWAPFCLPKCEMLALWRVCGEIRIRNEIERCDEFARDCWRDVWCDSNGFLWDPQNSAKSIGHSANRLASASPSPWENTWWYSSSRFEDIFLFFSLIVIQHSLAIFTFRMTSGVRWNTARRHSRL